MTLTGELCKTSLKYNIRRLIEAAVCFTIVFAIVLGQMFKYKPGWPWFVESCLLILWLCFNGRLYKKRKIEMDKALDRTLKYYREPNKGWKQNGQK